MRCAKNVLLILGALAFANAGLAGGGFIDPPYCLFSYVPDATDKPPLYYTKVCPIGKTEEKDAEYVVVGVWYPRMCQGVAPNYAGDLVIPERIDGLPVRKIMPAAFSLCQSLTSVSIPSTVREVGELAFSWCTALTNVTFAEGTAVVGSFAFTNCVSLQSVTFPKSLSFIGPGCFARCESLESVRFQGDAPRLDHSYRATDPYLGEKLTSYNGFAPRFKVFVPRTAFGWVRPYARGVPEKWPVDFGWMNAYPVEGYDIEKPRCFFDANLEGSRQVIVVGVLGAPSKHVYFSEQMYARRCLPDGRRFKRGEAIGAVLITAQARMGSIMV